MRRLAPKVEAIKATGALLVVASDVPADMTLSEWGRSRRAAPRRRRTLLSALRRRP